MVTCLSAGLISVLNSLLMLILPFRLNEFNLREMKEIEFVNNFSCVFSFQFNDFLKGRVMY